MKIQPFIATVIATTLTTTPALAKFSAWIYMGKTDSGESIYVNLDSIIYFVYKVDDEVIAGIAYCQENRWYASEEGIHSPSGSVTQGMVNYVCGV